MYSGGRWQSRIDNNGLLRSRIPEPRQEHIAVPADCPLRRFQIFIKHLHINVKSGTVTLFGTNENESCPRNNDEQADPPDACLVTVFEDFHLEMRQTRLIECLTGRLVLLATVRRSIAGNSHGAEEARD
jgi:hypothetical protein